MSQKSLYLNNPCFKKSYKPKCVDEAPANTVKGLSQFNLDAWYNKSLQKLTFVSKYF